MNIDAYFAVRRDPEGAGVGRRERAWLRLSGRDRQSFLNGQITNDVLYLQPGHGLHACLLNNTGHMLANIYVFAAPEDLWIEVTQSRAEIFRDTLMRFRVREKVEIEDVSADYETVTIQGQGARTVIANVLSAEFPETSVLPLSSTPIDLWNGSRGVLIQHQHTVSNIGFDIVVPAGCGQETLERLLAAPHAQQLDWETLQVLRIEAGIPKWGNELTEQTIPLEANLLSAINQNKGCYMGQEVIARIIARGHTNRTLVGFRLNALCEAGTTLQGTAGPQRNQDPAKITSVTQSPEAGPIALGFVRNEYAILGTQLHSADDAIQASVTALPFVA